MTAAAARVPRARWIVAAACVAVCAGILWLARDYTFFFDEWTFIITSPDWTLATYFQPHNEHPSILFRALYSLLLQTVGLRSYRPYLAVSLAAHFASVLLLFELVRNRNGDLVGVVSAVLLLVLGAGWEDLLWAFQMAWLISVAFGLAMLLALQGPSRPHRLAAAAACLLVSLSFSGIGLSFAVAAAVQLSLDAGRRHELVWLLPVAAALAAWYMAFGRFGNHPNPQPTAFNLLLDPVYALYGLSRSAAGVIGLAGPIGYVLLPLAALAIGWRWWRHRPDAFSLGVAAGLVAFYLITGLTRAQLGLQQSGSARYAYVAAVFWLILLADAARNLPWRGAWRPALVACFALAAANSGLLLLSSAGSLAMTMQRQVADYYALSAMRSEGCLDPAGAVDPQVMPAETSPAAYYRAIDRYGDPRAGLALVDRRSYEMGLMRLRKAGC